MRLTLDALLVLDAIHQQGSFAAAADFLHRVPSAITYSIKKLEQDLEVKLFNRSGHRAALTDAGKILLIEGRQLLNSVNDLEHHIKKISHGWESTLNIAVADMLPIDSVLKLVDTFYEQQSGTRIKLLTEVYGGAWDALVNERADLIIGAPDNGPSGGGYHSRKLGQIDWMFVIAADHPLANASEPISEEAISQYRAIAVADTSRSLTPRTAGIFTGQDVFTVPDFQTKIKAHLIGMGVGFLPRFLIEDELKKGLLIEKKVETDDQTASLHLAWKTGETGRSLQWFLDNINTDTFKEIRFK